LKLRSFICAAAVALLVWAAPADAEVQRPDEVAYITLRPGGGYELVVALYPRRNVAVVYAERGEPELKEARWSGAAYAVHPAPGAFEDGIDLDIGKVAKVQGHFIPDGPADAGHHSRFCDGRAPVSESGHFQGRIVFRGEGGYLRVRARRAEEHVSRSFRLRCKHGHAEKFKNLFPGLFGYLGSPAGTFSNRDGTILFVHTRDDRRITEFAALHHLSEQSSTFKAATLEWLPGEVAAMRWAELWRVAVQTFTTSLPQLHPATATVRPLAPFDGEATYSRATHGFEGDLSVDFPGLELPLAAPTSDAGICVFTRRMLDRVCDFG
jgi:hypothetical protein